MKSGRAFFILAPGQASEAFVVQDLPDGSGTQGSLAGFQSAFNFIDGEVLFAHPQDEFANGVLLGLGMRAAFEFAEEVGLGSAEMMAQDAKRAWGIAKALGDVNRGDPFDEEGAEGFVLALGGGGGLEEEAGFGS